MANEDSCKSCDCPLTHYTRKRVGLCRECELDEWINETNEAELDREGVEARYQIELSRKIKNQPNEYVINRIAELCIIK